MNFSDLTNNQNQEFKSLSKCQKVIANYIIENYDKAAFMRRAFWEGLLE